MKFLDVELVEGTATVSLNRPKVNALNEEFVEELRECLSGLAGDSGVKAVIITGRGSFFSFGFDVPGFMAYKKKSFQKYVMKFSKLTREIFMFPKPVIAGLNGHAVAGGTILALSCDYRVMVKDKPRISLNELTFGSTIFTSVAEYLKFAVGSNNAQKVLYSGKMFTAQEALSLGLVDEAVTEKGFSGALNKIALEYGSRDGSVFKSVKEILRSGTLKRIEKDEKRTISEFVDIWYSERTRKNLARIEIRS